MTQLLLAYHNKPELKEQAVAEVRWHREQDKLVQGYGYWQDGKGCAVGCRYHSSDHMQAEVVDGIPYLVARLEDVLFEGLPKEVAQLWPERYHSAIPTGADLSLVFYRFMHWLLADPGQVVKYADERGKVAITGVAFLYERYINGDRPTRAEWDNAARAAARAAADAAARAAADAAYAAADAAAYAAAAYAAADAAAAARAADARAADARARFTAYEQMADKLIELLSQAQAPVAVPA